MVARNETGNLGLGFGDSGDSCQALKYPMYSGSVSFVHNCSLFTSLGSSLLYRRHIRMVCKMSAHRHGGYARGRHVKLNDVTSRYNGCWKRPDGTSARRRRIVLARP